MDPVSIIASVIGSLIAAALLVLLAHSRGWIGVRWRSASDRRKLQKRLEAAGISNFYASRADYVRFRGAPQLLDYLKLARRSIRVAGYWMAHGTEMEGLALALAEMTRPPRSLQITIAIIDPMQPYIPAMASYLDMETRELVFRAQASLFKLWQARETLSTEEKARFRLKVYNSIPVASVIILDVEDDNGRLQVEMKPYKAPRTAAFALELTGHGRELYDVCANAWVRLLDEAADFDPKVHLVGFPGESVTA